MESLPLIDESEVGLLVAYSLSRDEEMTEGIVNAFSAADIDVFEKPTVLADWINPDVFKVLQWSADSPHQLITRIWDHQVVITGDQIRIYTTHCEGEAGN